METGHFLKMLNDVSLASLGFLIWKVLGCIICQNPLWILSCKVGPKKPCLAAGLRGHPCKRAICDILREVRMASAKRHKVIF